MDEKAKVVGYHSPPEAASMGLVYDLGRFALDAFTLAGLQARLLVADVRESSQRLVLPSVLLLCGITLGAACFPIVLAALALVFVQAFATSYAAGFLMAGGVGAVGCILLCTLGALKVRSRLAVMRRSQIELARNMRWVEKVIERGRDTLRDSFDNS